MKTPELKPCPFCGGEAELMYKYQNPDEPMLVRVRCRDCFINSPYKRNPQLHGWFYSWQKNKAIDAWNRRKEDD